MAYIYFSLFQRLRSPRWRYRQIQCLVWALFLAYTWPSSCCVLRMRESSLSCLFLSGHPWSSFWNFFALARLCWGKIKRKIKHDTICLVPRSPLERRKREQPSETVALTAKELHALAFHRIWWILGLFSAENTHPPKVLEVDRGDVCTILWLYLLFSL